MAAAALEQVLDRLQRLVRDRDHVAGADEEVELAGAEPAGGAVEDGEVEDDEEVVVVDVDLRPLVAGEDVLEVERVEVEVLLEPGALQRARVLDVDPAQAGSVDLLDVGGLWLSRSSGDDETRRAGRARRSRGFGRFGIARARRLVVQRRHRGA